MYGKRCSASTISGAGNFIYNGTHIRGHITTQAHLWCNHLKPGYHGDM
ncbi:hypothetical protein E2C01_102041 [Portunus trituberculatus]|uniref:Uncharacterized protein n=1 Tax=Portunus trituberculatus TaxID=210409 RepID=A0A5B7KBJ2_PORTR|nr:hypothetical protein [Portunus trituberculatus]